MTLIVHAPNIHQGGGRTLLLSVLNELSEADCVAFLDKRLDVSSLPENLVENFVNPTLLGRLFAEFHLRSLARLDDTVLCFGNLPPLLHNKGKVCVFLQNRYLYGKRDMQAFSFRTRLRIRIERLWFLFRFDETRMSLFVQTPSMAAELKRETGIKASVFPFAPLDVEGKAFPDEPEFDFIYVASGEPHKNHLRLLEAWRLLAEQGKYPSLCLTLEPATHHGLVRELLGAVRKYRLNITNLGAVHAGDIARCYKRSRALIYPSTLESFGLPLIEASVAGLPILASELDYVRDVARPAETFDPYSSISIARAVQRFMWPSNEPPCVFSSAEFVHAIQLEGPIAGHRERPPA